MSLWTPDGYVVGFTKMPGRHADYRAGRFRPEGCVVHFTVGRDSTGIGLRGTFPLLFPKVGPGKQFSPIDAVNFHACEWNHRLAGAETEKLNDGEETTPDQIRAWAILAAALREKGIPLTYYGGTERLPIGTSPMPAGYVAHRSLVHRSCDQHTDYLPDEDMARAFALAGGVGDDEEDDDVFVIYILEAPSVDGAPAVNGWVVADGTGYSWVDQPMMDYYRAARAYGVKSHEVHVRNPSIAATLAERAGPRPGPTPPP